MYEMFEKLCQSRNVTPYKVSKETGISRSTLSDWKTGKSTPKTDKLEKLAGYFGVTVDYLLTGKDVVQIIVDRGHEELEGAEYYIEVHADPDKFSNESLDRWNKFEMKRWLPSAERTLLEHYRVADPGTKAAVRKLLDISDEEIIEDDDLLPIAAHADDDATPEELEEDAALLREYGKK